MTTIVIMPGGFHPFHAGHAALYQSARRAFPDAEVYVAATNDTSTRPFPFPVKEKLAKLAGVEPGHFVQVTSPFQAKEITSQYNPAQDRLIFVRSEKDATKPPQPGGVKKDGSPSYLQSLETANKLEPFAKHAYMAYLPTVEFGPGMTSATEIRAEWPTLDEQGKLDRVMSLYPRTQGNAKLAATVVGLLDAAIGTQGVAEAFDQPYRSKTEKSESGSFDVLAKLPDGTNLSIMFNNNGNDEWQVEFYRNNSQEVTGEGDAQRIFATVLNAIQKFITKHKPAHLTFAASKETDPTVYYEPGEPQPNPASRAKLYDRLVQRYAKAWGYRAFRADNGRIVMYELSRMSQGQQGVAEGAPIVVAQAPIHIRNPKKAPQPYRNQGDIVPDTKPPSTEKRGVKGRPGQRPMPQYDEDTSRRGFLRGLGAAALAGAVGGGAMAQTMPNINAQQVELANKYYNALVQRAKEDGRELDTRTLNFLRAKAQEAAAKKFQQNNTQSNPQQGFPTQGSERRVAKDAGKFESQGVEENQGWAATFTNEETGQMAGTPASTGMWAGYQQRENQPVDEDYLEEKWSQKYKSSINCSDPKGFSQRAHCAGRKK